MRPSIPSLPRAGVLVFLVLLAVSTAVWRTSSGSAAFSGRNGLLLYQARVGSHVQLFVVRADGTAVRQLTHFRDSDADNGHWSPDSKRIVFNRHWNPAQPNERIEIDTMNADGSGIRQLKLKGKINVEPSWFPDGRRIVFLGAGKGFGIVNADGSGARILRISPWPEGVDNGNPRVSPDGRSIAWIRRSADGAQGAVFIARTDGSQVRRITSWSRSIADVVDWSPDGARLVFSSPDFDHYGYSEVYTVHPDGTSLQQLTNSHRQVLNGADSWSPDGKEIAFASDRGGVAQIYVMHSDGSDIHQLTHRGEAHLANWGTHS